MRIDSRQYGGRCVCGKEHRMSTRTCIIDSGVLHHLDEILNEEDIHGKRCAVYGSNTWNNPLFPHPRAEQEIVLPSEGLHADEHSTAEVLRQLAEDTEVLLACGSGSIHDTVRYCAAQRGIPFVALPTAASVDGYCSSVAAMTWHGYKNTMNAVAPLIVVADLDVISRAPAYLTASGVGDMLGKFIALSDWKIAHELTGEAVCPVIYNIMHESVQKIWDSCLDTLSGDKKAFESVMYGLLMSGLAMQMMGNSRPASGAEHHISHLIEMRPAGLGSINSPALHGEKVGVGTLIASRVYHQMAEREDISDCVGAYHPLDDGWLRSFYGETLYPTAVEENRNDCLAAVTPEAIVKAWPAIREIIAEIPTEADLYERFEKLGAKRCLSDLDVPEELLPVLIAHSPTVRNRLTLMRVRRMLNLS